MNAIGFLHRRSHAFLVTTGLILVVALGLLDYLSGPDVSFFVFYIAPIFLGVWFVGRGAGLLMCAASALSFWLVAELTAAHYSTRAVPYWNAAVRLGFLVTFTLVVSALRSAHEHERELARTDYMTGAVNFRHFTELAAVEINRAQRHEHPLSLAFMDVDDFKVVNDRFGHSAGDALLRAAAETIRSCLRSIDVVARLGGDEFAVLLPETGAEAAETAVRRLRRSLLELARERRLPVTFSIGVVTWDAPPASVNEMLKAADRLMYAAKHGGKNRIRHETWDEPANAA
jgi:diguanylate cyclase (GGDEF)-like protein